MDVYSKVTFELKHKINSGLITPRTDLLQNNFALMIEIRHESNLGLRRRREFASWFATRQNHVRFLK